jgi:ubiquinone/menaquinone biosynthesis C-methylase UbiE
MSELSKISNVQEQYADSKNLSVRVKLHQTYSTNPYEFSQWLFDKYEFFEGCRILELGCGNGGFWENRINKLPENSSFILSDFSRGMVDEVYNKFSSVPNISVRQIDIQDIPFPDQSFNIVIANHMLYHVPDLPKALSEVNRVLKPGGTFYSSTVSSGGMHGYLHDALKDFNPNLDAYGLGDYSFTVENGYDRLTKHFSSVELFKLSDSLKISKTRDLIDWIESTISISRLSSSDIDGLYDYFENIRLKSGFIEIPKLSGVFISRK